MADINKLYSDVNNILKGINVKKIDPNKDDFQSLPTGYYLCSFKLAVTTSNAGNLQVKSEMKVVEPGLAVDAEGDFVEIKGTLNRKMWKYYSLKDEESVTKLIKDMLKFEDEDGESLLVEEDFASMEQIEAACEVVEDMQLYVNVNTYTKDGETKSFINVLSWKRAEELGLLGDE